MLPDHHHRRRVELAVLSKAEQIMRGTKACICGTSIRPRSRTARSLRAIIASAARPERGQAAAVRSSEANEADQACARSSAARQSGRALRRTGFTHFPALPCRKKRTAFHKPCRANLRRSHFDDLS